MLFAYFGPETLMPLTSIIAGAAGVFLLFGKNSIRLATGGWLWLLRQVGWKRATPPPHGQTSTPAEHSTALDRRRARSRSTAPTGQQDPHGQ